MTTPKSKRELYAAMLPLVPLFEQFKATNEANLRAGDVELIKSVYDDVVILSSGGLPRVLNTGCTNCMREAFSVYISLFDRMAEDPSITEENEVADSYKSTDMGELAGNAPLSDNAIQIVIDGYNSLSDEDRGVIIAKIEESLGGVGARFITNIDGLSIEEKAQHVAYVIQHLGGLQEYYKNSNVDPLTGEVKTEPVKPVPEYTPDPTGNPLEKQDDATVIKAPEVNTQEPASTVADEASQPLNTPATLSPQQRAAITRAENKAKATAAAPAQTTDTAAAPLEQPVATASLL